MADFRRWFLAFALLALVSSVASAQFTPQFQCLTNGSGTPTIRNEGLAELLGDIVLTCTGGTPTPAGIPVPQATITIFLNTNLTSLITSTSGATWLEAFLIADEPHSPSNPAVPLVECDPANTNAAICSALGTPTGNGVGTYSSLVGGNGSSGNNGTRVNVFQGRLTGANQVTFFGVPIDPPGTNGTRIFRITNLRGNANQLGLSSTLVPTQIVANISVTPSQALPINNPQQTVAFIRPGLVTSVRNPKNYTQCNDVNPDVAKGNTTTSFTTSFAVRFDEGFASSWKEKNIQTHLNNMGNPATASYPSDRAQDVPGSLYYSETGFLVNGITPSGTYPIGFGPFLTANTSFNGNRGSAIAGTASQGTRLMISFASVPNGSQIWVPLRVAITTPSTGVTSGFAVLAANADGNGLGGLLNLTGSTGTITQVSLFNGAGTAVYEVLEDDPLNIERMDVNTVVAYVSNVASNLPAPGIQSTATGSFAPLSNVGTASSTAPIPRFVPSATPTNSFIIQKCSCDLLFPFVSNQQGFDTGVAISNTTLDPYGTAPQAGTVTLNYYSAGTPPPAQTTNAVVPAGQTLTFTLSGGGNFGINPTPGFQGYIIAQAQFQYCHAFAYISAQGALPTAPGASEGYLGIVLDPGGLNRGLPIGENDGH